MSPAGRYLSTVALLVRDYDEAKNFYINKLHFNLIEDTHLGKSKRWVVISPGAGSCNILLAKASNAKQMNAVGNQSGGRVFLFIHTDNFDHDYENLLSQGITIVRGPVTETYGKVVVFEDLYGNRWDLIGL